MTDESTKAIAEAAAKAAAHEVLLQLGIDTSDPLKVQQDMAFLRRQRVATESLRLKKGHVILGMVLSGVGGLLVLGFLEFIKTGGQ